MLSYGLGHTQEIFYATIVLNNSVSRSLGPMMWNQV